MAEPIQIVTTDISGQPNWLKDIVKRQVLLNEHYEKARRQFAAAWNDFFMAVEEVNAQNGTTFTVEQAFQEFQCQFTEDGFDVEDADDDEKE